MNNSGIVNRKDEDRVSYGFFAFFTFLACLFAYIINKEVELSAPVMAVIGIFGIGALMAATFHKPEVGIYALAAYLPFSKILVGDFGGMATAFNLTNILIIIVLMGHLMSSTFRNKPVSCRSFLSLPILLFCLLGIVSLLRGTHFFGTRYLSAYIISVKRWLTPVLLYFLTLFVVRDKKVIKNVIIIMMIVTVVVGLLAIKEAIDIGPRGSLDRERIGAIAEQPNQLGAFFCSYMFLVAGFLLSNWKKFRYWLLLIPLLICFRGIQLTFSRGTYVAFGFGALGLCFFKSKRLFILAIVFLIFSYFNPVFIPKGMQYRLGKTFVKEPTYVETVDDLQDSLDTSAARRVEVWKGSLRIIHDYPWLGIGYGMFPKAIPFYCGVREQMDAHNAFLLMAAEMGIPTLVVFLWIFLIILKNTWWVNRHTDDPFFKAASLGFLGGLSGFFMANMFGSRMSTQEVVAYFWMLAALMIRIRIMQTNPVRRVSTKQRHKRTREHTIFGKRAMRFQVENGYITKR